MSENPITEKPLFSFKELMYICTLIIGFGIQYFTIKIQIHDAISEIDFNKKEQTFKFEALASIVSTHERKIEDLTTLYNAFAIKPKSIKIESE